jgi:hypothetical protein
MVAPDLAAIKVINKNCVEDIAMRRFLQFLVTASVICVIALTAESSPVFGLGFATCVGADPCHACTSCRYCQYCAKAGGTCGVCKR